MNVAALKAECKARGIKGYSKLRKEELVAMLAEGTSGPLQEHDRANAPEPEPAKVEPVEVAPIVETPKPEPKGASFTGYTHERQPSDTVMAMIRKEKEQEAEKERRRKARNKAKARRRAIRASGGVAGWA